MFKHWNKFRWRCSAPLWEKVVLCKTYFNSVTDVVLCVEEAQQCELAEKHYKCHLLVRALLCAGWEGLWMSLWHWQWWVGVRWEIHQVSKFQLFWNLPAESKWGICADFQSSYSSIWETGEVNWGCWVTCSLVFHLFPLIFFFVMLFAARINCSSLQ